MNHIDSQTSSTIVCTIYGWTIKPMQVIYFNYLAKKNVVSFSRYEIRDEIGTIPVPILIFKKNLD